jgi:hypothetical protein
MSLLPLTRWYYRGSINRFKLFDQMINVLYCFLLVESTVVRLIHNCISDFCLSSVACISGLDPYISFEPINSIHLITKVYACWIITIYLCISCWVSKCSFSHEFYSTGSSTYQYVEYLAHVQFRSRKNKVSKVSCFNLGGYTY